MSLLKKEKYIKKDGVLMETQVTAVASSEVLAQNIFAKAKNIANLVNCGKLSGRIFVQRINVRNEEIPENIWVIALKDEKTPDHLNEAAKLFVIDSRKGFIWVKSESGKYRYKKLQIEKLEKLENIDLEYIYKIFSEIEQDLSY